MARDWRVAGCINDLRTELNRLWPDRAKPDGTIGDQKHQARTSSHNPDRHGVVRAIDVKVKGIDAVLVVDRLVALGISDDPRLRGGYVIHDGCIWSADHQWRRRVYTGENPHREHIHLSVTDTPKHYDQRGPWGINVPQPEPEPEPAPQKEDDVFVTTVNKVGWLVAPTGRIQIVSTADYASLKGRFGEVILSDRQLDLIRDVTFR